MKRLLPIFILLMLVVPAFANYAPNPGMKTTDWSIATVTIYGTTAAYSLTLEAGAVAYIDVYADGGDLRWTKGGTTTEAYFVTPNGSTYSDHFQIPFAKGYVLQFWSPTVGTVARVKYGYY